MPRNTKETMIQDAVNECWDGRQRTQTGSRHQQKAIMKK